MKAWPGSCRPSGMDKGTNLLKCDDEVLGVGAREASQNATH